MGSWLDRFGLVLIDASISAATLLALASLALVVCRQPARRLYLARAAVVSLLALVPLKTAGLVPALNLSTPLLVVKASPGTQILTPLRVRAPATAWPGGWVVRVLSLTYLAGVGCGVAGMSLGYLGLSWLASRSSWPSPATSAFYASLPFRRGRRRPRLYLASRLRQPVLVGWLRPVVLIPKAFDPPGEESTAAAQNRLRLGLLHELAHAEGSDVLFAAAGQLAQVVWFFLPPVWWVVGRMRLDQEFLADRRAAIGFGPLGSYASSLLEFASSRDGVSPSKERVGAIEAGLDRGGSALFQRVLMLVRCPFPVEPAPPSWWTWAVPCLVVLATLGAAGLSFRPGAVAATAGSAAASSPGTARIFRLSRLELSPSPPDKRGRSARFELPVRLPERFELSLKVWGDQASLARTRVAGLPLEFSATPSITSDPGETWHEVRIRRDDGGVWLWIDDRFDPLARAPSGLTLWLSLQAEPDHEGYFSDLSLIW